MQQAPVPYGMQDPISALLVGDFPWMSAIFITHVRNCTIGAKPMPCIHAQSIDSKDILITLVYT